MIFPFYDYHIIKHGSYPTHECKKKHINTNMDSFIPKYEISPQIELVSDFLFLLFSKNSNKQNKLVNN